MGYICIEIPRLEKYWFCTVNFGNENTKYFANIGKYYNIAPVLAKYKNSNFKSTFSANIFEYSEILIQYLLRRMVLIIKIDSEKSQLSCYCKIIVF